MRFGAVPTITLSAFVAILGCAPNKPTTESSPGAGGAGGNSAQGGSSGSGGSDRSGGSSGTGSSSARGGATSSGGGDSAGGATSAGGSVAEGGSSAGAGAGGLSAAGGGAVAGAGGASGAAGGAAGACSDDPPPGSNPCSDWKSWGNCSSAYLVDNNYCNKTCDRCSGSVAGASGSGGASSRGGASGAGGAGTGGATKPAGSGGAGGATSPGSTNPPITGSNGFATRYWDCCKPSCSWTTSVPACQKDGVTRISDKNARSGCDSGGSAFECYDFSPWYDAATNMSYGFAAHNGVACGTCFMLQFTGQGNSNANDPGSQKLKGQQMIVQAINIGGIDGNQFDLLIPGGGVGAMNGCSTQWGGSTDLGVQYGGLLSECGGKLDCMIGKCESVFGKYPALKAGCDWFTGWFSGADNPKIIYKQVSCPSQITSKSNLSH